jgi:outer membrane protein OmpA-like peptidoglycan-associated protein
MKNRFLLLLTFSLAVALPGAGQSGSNSTDSSSTQSTGTGATQTQPADTSSQNGTGSNSSQNPSGASTGSTDAAPGQTSAPAQTTAPAQNSGTTPSTSSQNPDQNSSDQQQPFTYSLKVTQRSTQAVDYRDRGGTTQIDFKGSALMPKADGRARVTGHTGRLAIDAAFHHLDAPGSLGPEFLTYVLWAIDPEGRAANLGEVVPNDNGDATVQVTSGFQEFGMILTAEPYFAVSRPGDVLVAENMVRQDTAGGIHPITARYELLQKGQYTVNVSGSQLPAASDRNSPLQVKEAENAIAIAQAAGADQYASDTLHKAKDYLHQAQEYIRQKQNRVPVGTVSRAATQAAEDARLISLEKKQQEQVAAERQAAQDKITQAQTQADQESARAEAARLDAQHQTEQRALAEQERLAADQARQQSEQARLEAQQARDQAQQQLQQAQTAQQQALAAQQAAVQQQQLLSQQAEQARAQAQQAEQQRQRLLQQLNQVLQTKDTAKGLIVNVSDVLFDTGKATLKQGAQLRLARVAGIILAYPDLKLEIDGYTDSTGTPEFNQKLSDKRASTVRDFLVTQGLSSGNVSARGYGQSDPVASNKTPAGRQQNRRVELVVSGTAIGQNIAPAAGVSGTGGVSGAATSPAAMPGQSAPNQPSGVAAPGTMPPPATTTPTSTTPGTPPSGGNPPKR